MSKVNGRIGSFVPAPAVIAPPRVVIDASRVEYVPVAAVGRFEAARAEYAERRRFRELMDASDADNSRAANAA
jgi:hypothetical protein